MSMEAAREACDMCEDCDKRDKGKCDRCTVIRLTIELADMTKMLEEEKTLSSFLRYSVTEAELTVKQALLAKNRAEVDIARIDSACESGAYVNVHKYEAEKSAREKAEAELVRLKKEVEELRGKP